MNVEGNRSNCISCIIACVASRDQYPAGPVLYYTQGDQKVPCLRKSARILNICI